MNNKDYSLSRCALSLSSNSLIDAGYLFIRLPGLETKKADVEVRSEIPYLALSSN